MPPGSADGAPRAAARMRNRARAAGYHKPRAAAPAEKRGRVAMERGTKSLPPGPAIERKKLPSVRPFIHPSIRPFIHPSSAHRGGSLNFASVCRAADIPARRMLCLILYESPARVRARDEESCCVQLFARIRIIRRLLVFFALPLFLPFRFFFLFFLFKRRRSRRAQSTMNDTRCNDIYQVTINNYLDRTGPIGRY